MTCSTSSKRKRRGHLQARGYWREGTRVKPRVSVCAAVAVAAREHGRGADLGLIVTQFEDTIAQVAVLAALMPIIAARAATRASRRRRSWVRALALDEIDLGDLMRVLGKEIAPGV